MYGVELQIECCVAMTLIPIESRANPVCAQTFADQRLTLKPQPLFPLSTSQHQRTRLLVLIDLVTVFFKVTL
jgi:hypothetical protein